MAVTISADREEEASVGRKLAKELMKYSSSMVTRVTSAAET